MILLNAHLLANQITTVATQPSMSAFIQLLIRFGFNMFILLILIRLLYYSNTRRKDYLFTFILIGTIIFFISYLLANIGMQMGFAIGLFAVFGIIRYRTFPMPIREMTYLFMTIGISVVNALSNLTIGFPEILFANLSIVLLTFILEKLMRLRHESCKIVVYEKIELIQKEKRAQLIEDLQIRTGVEKINRVDVGQINFLKDSVVLKIYYNEYGNLHV